MSLLDDLQAFNADYLGLLHRAVHELDQPSAQTMLGLSAEAYETLRSVPLSQLLRISDNGALIAAPRVPAEFWRELRQERFRNAVYTHALSALSATR